MMVMGYHNNRDSPLDICVTFTVNRGSPVGGWVGGKIKNITLHIGGSSVGGKFKLEILSKILIPGESPNVTVTIAKATMAVSNLQGLLPALFPTWDRKGLTS